MRRITTLATLLVVVLAACSGSSEPTATYTGGACDYDGPSEFDINSTVTFTVTNESDTTEAGFAIWDLIKAKIDDGIEAIRDIGRAGGLIGEGGAHGQLQAMARLNSFFGLGNTGND